MRDDLNKSGHIWTGVFILLIGVAALVKTAVPVFPDWLFSWKTLLIAIGIFLGLKHNFKGFAWLILMVIGGVFLLRDVYPEFAFRRYIWPVALIAIGAFLILRPRSVKNSWHMRMDTGVTGENESWNQDDFIDSTSIFSGSKKNMLSKNFKGGDIVNIFGGTELNLVQADIQGRAELEITTIFGGAKLIIPSHWEVKSEVVSIFGGLEDKRSLQQIKGNPDKILLLKGTVLFGGIEIKSF
jgi:predicted membrane protein